MNLTTPVNSALLIRDENGKLSINGFVFSSRGLERVDNAPTIEQAEQALSFFHRVNELSLVAIGDLVNWIERERGKTYKQISAVTGLSEQTLYNASSVMRHVPRENRRGGLTFADYCAVAPLEPDEQEVWIDKRVSGEIKSAAQLEIAIHKERPDAMPEFRFECPHCGTVLVSRTPVHLIGED